MKKRQKIFSGMGSLNPANNIPVLAGSFHDLIDDVDLIDADLQMVKNSLITPNVTQEYEVDRLLTDAEVTGMFSTPVALVPAPGAERVIEVVSDPIFITKYGTAAFTGGGDITIRSGTTIISSTISAANSLGSTADRVAKAAILDTAAGILLSVNAPINLANATAAFVKGTSTSTLRVRFKYRIHTV